MNIQTAFATLPFYSYETDSNSCYVVIIKFLIHVKLFIYFAGIVSRWKETQVENWKHNNISVIPTTDAS